jgi:ribosomal protein L7/L12
MKIEISQAELSELILQLKASSQDVRVAQDDDQQQQRVTTFMREFASLAQAISSKQKIAAIRSIRAMSGMGLMDAEDVVESVGSAFWYPPPTE